MTPGTAACGACRSCSAADILRSFVRKKRKVSDGKSDFFPPSPRLEFKPARQLARERERERNGRQKRRGETRDANSN